MTKTPKTEDRPGRRAAATTPPGTTAMSPELESEIEAIAEDSGCELVHAEFRGNVLRIFIDRPETPGGVDLSDCETVSRQVSALLDVVDFGPGRYTLEVSSPGLDRRLYRPRDYRRFVGSLTRVTYRNPESGKKQTVVGRLRRYLEAEEADGQSPEIQLELTDRDERLALPLDAIEVARLEIEL